MLEVYQSNTFTAPIIFTGENGPWNVSGAVAYYVAKRSYSDSIDDAIINKPITGANAEATSGILILNLTTGDTSHCVGDYIAGVTLFSGTNVITYTDDGLRIRPSPMGISL
jgi:hypothetical protein